MPHFIESQAVGQQLLGLICTSPDAPTLLSDMAATLGREGRGEACAILAGLQPGGTLQGAFWTPGQSRSLPAKAVEGWLEHLPVAEVAARAGAAALPDCQETLRELAGQSLTWLAMGTRFRGTANGIVLLGRPPSLPWGREEAEWLESVGGAAAIAAFLLSLQQQVPVPRAGMGVEENPILRVWYEATRQQLNRQHQLNAQLTAQLNHLVHSIVTTMSDRIRNPLANLRMGIELLRQPQLSLESRQQRLDILEQEWQKLNDINDKILKFKTLKSQPSSFQAAPIPLEEMVAAFVESYQARWREDRSKSLRLEWEASPHPPLWLYSDAEHLKTILAELLTNAGKFSDPNTAVSLEIRERTEGQEVELEVANISGCIPQENLPYLFDPFYREESAIDRALPGVGIGLAIVKECVQLLQGKIEVACQPAEESGRCRISFKLILPQFPPPNLIQ